MAGIILCTTKTCLSYSSCKRGQLLPNKHWQAYQGFQPDSTGKCENYLSNSYEKGELLGKNTSSDSL